MKPSLFYVYSLKCQDGFYIGLTNNLEERIKRHQAGLVESTKNRLPISLEFYIATPNKYKAYKLEKYFESGSGRAFVKKHLS
jgi:predicted GIY-YIG superfamily endonuclease